MHAAVMRLTENIEEGRQGEPLFLTYDLVPDLSIHIVIHYCVLIEKL